jgi:hypothetical protein
MAAMAVPEGVLSLGVTLRSIPSSTLNLIAQFTSSPVLTAKAKINGAAMART